MCEWAVKLGTKPSTSRSSTRKTRVKKRAPVTGESACFECHTRSKKAQRVALGF